MNMWRHGATLLLNYNANVNAFTRKGTTVLLVSVTTIAKLLLDRNASVDTPDAQQMTQFIFASRNRLLDSASLLLDSRQRYL